MLYSTFKPMSHLCRHALYNASVYVFSALNSINTSIPKCNGVFLCPSKEAKRKAFPTKQKLGSDWFQFCPHRKTSEPPQQFSFL